MEEKSLFYLSAVLLRFMRKEKWQLEYSTVPIEINTNTAQRALFRLKN